MNIKTNIIKFDSANVSSYTNSYLTGFMSNFEPIICEDNETMFYSLQQISIPYSFYGVNHTNQYLDITETVGGQSYNRTVIMPAGNYSAMQYQATLLPLLNASTHIDYTMTYSSIQNRYTIGIITQNVTVNFLFKTGTNGESSNFAMLGFDHEDITISSSILSQNCIIMNTIQYIMLKTNLGNHSRSSAGTDSMLEIINIQHQPNAFIFFQPLNQTKYMLNNSSLSSVSIELTDNNNNVINLNGVPYHFTIRVDIIKKQISELIQNTGRPRDTTMDDGIKTNVEMIRQQPDLLRTVPPSINDLIEFREIQRMIYHEKLKANKKKLKKRLNYQNSENLKT